jgi:tetratricopeptide (TPR) repeat protein
MNRTILITVGIVVAVFAAGIVQFVSPRYALSPTLTAVTSVTEQNVGTTTSLSIAMTTAVVTKRPTANPLPIVAGDDIASWSFAGAYSDNQELIAKADAEIKRLQGLIGKGTYSDVAILVGIANQYDLVGDGKREYEYLGTAVNSSTENGLPWHNLGVLMEKLGAFKTARIAYEKSVLALPRLDSYQYSYIEFLITRMKDDSDSIEKAFSDAEKNIGQTQYLAELRAEWQKP